jgi:hypothetical protein
MVNVYYCPHCGGKVNTGYNTCPNCGKTFFSPKKPMTDGEVQFEYACIFGAILIFGALALWLASIS